MHLETPLISSCHILSIHPHFISDWNVETAGPEGNITGITRILSKYQQGEWNPQHVCKCTDTRTHSPSLASYFSLSTWPFRGPTQHHFSSVLYYTDRKRTELPTKEQGTLTEKGVRSHRLSYTFDWIRPCRHVWAEMTRHAERLQRSLACDFCRRRSDVWGHFPCLCLCMLPSCQDQNESSQSSKEESKHDALLAQNLVKQWGPRNKSFGVHHK